MEPTYTCPPGHRLDNKMCVIPPTLSCPTGYELVNGMCQKLPEMSMTSPNPVPQPPPPVVTSPVPPPPPVVTSPIPPMMGSNCPTGYQFSSVDNMCYPLKI